MYKRFREIDKRVLDFEFSSGSRFDMPRMDTHNRAFFPQDTRDKLETLAAVSGAGMTKLSENRTSEELSASAAYGSVNLLSKYYLGQEASEIYGHTDTQMRFFTAFMSGATTHIPIGRVIPKSDSRL